MTTVFRPEPVGEDGGGKEMDVIRRCRERDENAVDEQYFQKCSPKLPLALYSPTFTPQPLIDSTDTC